jgi:hypothetical protein
MGRWREAGPSEWRLHLALSSGRANAEDDVRDHLPRSVGALAQLPGASSAMAAALQQAQAAIEATIAAFPNPTVVAASAAQAATALEAARAACPVRLKPIVDHRLERKMLELDAVLAESAGPQVRARADPPRLSPGGQGKLFVSATSDGGEAKIAVDVTARDGIHVAREGVENGADRFRVTVSEKAEFTSPYPVSFDPLAVDGEVGLGVSTTIGARIVRRPIRLEEPLRVLPATSLMLDPDAVIVNLARPLSEMHVAARVDGSEAVGVAVMPPAGWGFSTATGGFVLNPPANVRPGRFSIAATVAGHAASRIQRASYPHIGSLEWAEPAALPGLAVEAALPEGVRIAYVGGGNDRVDFWLRQLGLEVTSLDAAALEHADFAPFTTIVIGIFAFGTRPDLAAARGRLRRWVEAGGHLVTLYHRPSDGWSPDDTPPRRLEIGTPSLRWRVTDPSAPVTVLAPDHALLTAPNKIAAGDWAGWDKERGLYFAARWDEAYIPLLAMSDKDEVPLSGSLLSAIIGRGRHTHTALVLHHQLEKLVPGAFRLLANLVQRA